MRPVEVHPGTFNNLKIKKGFLQSMCLPKGVSRMDVGNKKPIFRTALSRKNIKTNY